MAEIDFSKEPTPDELKVIAENSGISVDDARKAWAGAQTTQQFVTPSAPSGPVGRFQQLIREGVKGGATDWLKERPGLLSMTGGTPEGVGTGLSEVASLLPATTGEAVMDALLLGRGLMGRSAKLGARLLSGVAHPIAAGGTQAAIDYGTGERTGPQALTQGVIRTATQGVGDVAGSFATRHVLTRDARILGKTIEPIFPNAGTAEDLLKVAGELTKARRVVGGLSFSLDDLEGIIKKGVLPRPYVSTGHIIPPPNTGVATTTVSRPAPGAPAGLVGAPGAGTVGFQIASVEDVINRIRTLRANIRQGLEVRNPLADEAMVTMRRQEKKLEKSLLSQLSPSGQIAWTIFDDTSRKAEAIRKMLQVSDIARKSTTPGIDMGAIHRELVNFKEGRTPLVKILDDAFKNEGGATPILEAIYRDSGKFGAQDISYGPLRMFSMLAGTGAAGGIPVGKLASKVGKMSGGPAAIAAGTTTELGRLGREFMSSSSLIGSPEVQ